MELNQLEYFLAVARCENMSEAAEKLFLTQPALSKAISELEKEFDAPLFERAAGRLKLTESGRVLAGYVQKIEHSLERAQDRIRVEKNRHQVTIAITAKSSAEFLAALNYSFLNQYPSVSLKIRNEPFSPDNRFSGNFILYPSLTPVTEETRRTLFTEKVLVALPKGHPLCKKDSLTLADLAAESLILLPPGDRFRELISGFFQEAGLPLSVKMECDNYLSVLPMVEAGAGISLIPERSWGKQDAFRRVVLRSDLTPALHYCIIFGWLPEEKLSREAILYRDFLLSYFSTLPDEAPAGA